MEMFTKMLQLQMVLMIYLFVGFLARKKQIITEDNVTKFIDLVLRLLMPCMVFQSFHQTLTFEKLRQAGVLLLVSFGVGIFCIFVGKICYRKYPYEKKSILQYATLVNNAGFAGMPMTEGVYGVEGLFYASIAIIPNRIYMWSAGISLFTTAPLIQRIKSVALNPNIIAVVLGLIRALAEIEFPGFLDKGLTNMGNMVAPFSMIIVGSILAEVDIKTVIDKDVLYLALIRLICIPALVGLFMKLMPVDATAAGALLVLNSMPAGTTTALMAAKYGADVQFASKCVFVTTVLSLITVPLMMFFL